MDEKKILELSLIENRYKKKKNNNYNDFYILKNDLFSNIDAIIDLEFKKKNICFKQSEEFIKENMVNLIEIYININRHLKIQNNKHVFIKNIVDELINNIVYRCNKNNINNDIKIIDLQKKK